MRPPAQKIQPIGFSGRREATTAPTVVNVKASKARRTIVPRLGKIWAEALKNPSTPPPKAANGKEIAHIDHAIQVAARALISPTSCPCSLAPSVTTPLYSTTVCQTLRQTLRGLFSEPNSAEPSKDSPKNGGKRCMLASVAECS